MFKHKGIVELYHYTETSDDIDLFMEYANDPTYFENRLEIHKREIKKEEKLKRYAT